MTPQEFANKIRTKYPGSYDSMSDDDLAKKVVAKYPVYASQVNFTPTAPIAPKPSLTQRAVTRTGEIIKEAAKPAIETGEKIFDPSRSFMEKTLLSATMPLRAVGTGIKAAAGVAMEPVSKAIGAMSEEISNIPAVQRFAQGKYGTAISEGASNFANDLAAIKDKIDPELYKSIADTVEIATTVMGAKPAKEALTAVKETAVGAGKVVAQEAELTARMAAERAKQVASTGLTKTGEVIKGTAKGAKEKIVRGTDEAIQYIETGTLKDNIANVDKIIDTSIERAVRPSVTGKQSSADIEKYKTKSRDAVKTIVANKSNLKLADEAGEAVTRLPESLSDFGSAVSQTKTQIFKKFNDLSKQAGELEAKVDLNPIADDLDEISTNPVLSDVNPNVIKYAEERSSTFRKRGEYTPEQTEEAIKFYNQSLDAFYKNPSYDNASKVAIDAMIVNKMRQGLDNVIETATGSQYQALKNQYSSLKTIEKDITRRTIVEGRKNTKGLIDYTDIFSAGDAIAAIATMNPALMAKATTQFAVKELYKRWVSPDATIKRMFESVEKAVK